MKYEIIKIKKEELNYIDNIAKLSSTRKLSEKEKLEVYQKLESYKEKLKALFEKYYLKLIKDENKDFDFNEVIIKFNIDKLLIICYYFLYIVYRRAYFGILHNHCASRGNYHSAYRSACKAGQKRHGRNRAQN